MNNFYQQKKGRDQSAELEVKSNLQICISKPNLAVKLSLVE